MNSHQQAVKRGEEMEFAFFGQNRDRQYHIRLALPDECEHVESTHMLSRYFIDGKNMVVHLREVWCETHPIDADMYLVDAWSRLERMHLSGERRPIAIPPRPQLQLLRTPDHRTSTALDAFLERR